MIIKRGDIWLANLDPTLGTEIRKTRPVVIISSDSIGKLPIKLVAPITDWKAHFKGHLWMIKVNASPTNSLDKDSAVDILQLRGLDTHERLINKLGKIEDELLKKITLAIRLITEG